MNYSKSKILFQCSLIFLLGIFVSSFLPEIFFRFHFLYFLVSIVFLFLILVFRKDKNFLFVFLIIFTFSLAFWRYAVSESDIFTGNVCKFNGSEVLFSGLVRDDPQIKEKRQKLEIAVDYLIFADREVKVKGTVLVNINHLFPYQYGDYLQVKCRLQSPEASLDFAYDRYLARFGIYSVCYYPRIKILEGKKGNFIYAKIIQIRNGMKNIIRKGLGEPEAGLLQAILLGDKSGLGDELREQFSRVGISHIVAISGMHIGILSLILMELLLFLGLWRRQAFYLSCIFLLFYIVLIGSPASAVRAGVMWFFVFLAMNIGRISELKNSVFFVAVLILIINPRLLRDDVGFQLSFLAILGIAYLYPKFEEFFENKKIPRFLGMRDILAVTIAVQIFTAPVIIYNFSQISWVAPVSNLLIIWILPFVMVFGFSGIILSFIFPFLTSYVFIPSYLSLKYVLYVVEFLFHF